ncbi:hypothetical protein QJR28_09580 [Clostridium baratii]|uniref:hypothetical protein n=1 Tax=Clostridium baratii TaxID=1561 RepID=UPI0030D02D8C
MDKETDFFIKFMENNTNEVVKFCNTIELKKIKNETNKLNERIIETLTNNPEKMAKAIMLLLGILARERVDGNENLELNGYKKIKKYLEYMDEVIND